jgi:CHAT domain-containing protein
MTMDPEDNEARTQRMALDLWDRYIRSGDLRALEAAVGAFRAAADAANQDAVSLSNLSNALLVLYQRTHDRGALDEAVDVGRAAVDRSGLPAARAAALNNLSGALKASFKLTGDVALLDEATEVLRLGAAEATDDANRGILLCNLANALDLRYQRTESLDSLREATQALRQGLALRAKAGPVPMDAVTSLWNLLRICYQRTGDESSLTEAIAIGRQLASAGSQGAQRAGQLSNLAVVLRLRYELTGETDVLHEAVAAARTAVAEAGETDHVLLASLLSNLGNVMLSGYERTGDAGMLTESLGVLRRAIVLMAAGHPERAQILANADRVLELSYLRTGEATLLDEWARVRREWLSTRPGQDTHRSIDLAARAELIKRRFEATGEPAILDEVIATLREAWTAADAETPERGSIFLNLGIALRVRHRAGAGEATIAEAVSVLRAAVATMQSDDSDLGPARTNLALALQSQYESSGDPLLLDEAISTGTALAASHPGPAVDAMLADSLAARYESTGGDEDLRRSMELFGGPEAVAAANEPSSGSLPDFPSWAVGPIRRANVWMSAYNSRSDVAALDRAVAAWDRLFGHPWFDTLPGDIRATALGGTALAHLSRYDQRSDSADLDEALRYGASSVEFSDHGDYRANLSNFSLALKNKYERDGDMDSLVRAADVGQRVVQMTTDGSSERADALTNLGGIWRRIREATGSDTYLDAEVAAWEEAAQIPEGEPTSRGRRLNNASVGLHNRYDARGSDDDLQRSIAYSRQAVETAPAEREISGWRSNLGNTLRHRYERTGVVADLDDAIEVLERAVAEAPDQWQGRRECLSNLGSVLRARARLSRSGELAQRALQAATEAVELTPATSVEYDLYAGNLAVALGEFASATGNTEHLDAQIALYDELLAGIPESAVRRSWLQANLAAALLSRHKVRDDPAILDRVLVLTRAALARTAPGTPVFADRTALLAEALAAESADGQAEEADRAFRDATVTALTIAPAQALRTAVQWARWREGGQAWPTAVEAYQLAAAAVERLFSTQVGRQDKEVWLRAANGMPAQAAFALVRTGQAEAAALTLERGRVRLLTEALGRNNAALDRLADHGAGSLAERFRAAQRRLGALEAGEANAIHGEQAADRMRGDDLASALAEHGAALDAIRRVPGYERFLRPPDPADLARAADEPIVYLAAARLGGVALIVTRAQDSTEVSPTVQAVELPRLTDTALQREASALRYARQAHDRDPGLWQGTLDAVCRWLWSAALEPLISALGDLPSVSLVPTGLLAALPLHAAWTEDERRPTGRRYAADDLVISYVPSAGTLLHARDLAAEHPVDDLFGVVDPRPVDAAPLPLAEAEVAAGAAALGISVSDVRGGAASRRRVLAELPGHAVVHFACHGLAKPDIPLHSALLMADDERLTLADLFELELSSPGRPGIRLAVLSACETQLPGTELPDELVSLPSGFMQAGSAAVVASQWRIADAAAALVVSAFYRNLGLGLPGPAALRAAQTWLRDTTDGDKATFLHPRSGQSGLPEAAARPLWRWLVTRPAGQRSFAQPSQWAAMTYTGA